MSIRMQVVGKSEGCKPRAKPSRARPFQPVFWQPSHVRSALLGKGCMLLEFLVRGQVLSSSEGHRHQGKFKLKHDHRGRDEAGADGAAACKVEL